MKRTAKTPSLLDQLKAEEARDVLRRLLLAHPELRAETEKIARSMLAEIDFEQVADEVEDEVHAVDVDDVRGRAGRHEWGYVEPTEAAWEVLEEAIEPFIADIKRQTDLGLEKEALETCKGVVLGLYRAEHGKGTPVLEEAPDFPAEAATRAIETWRGRALPAEFVDRFVPEWKDMMLRVQSRKGKS